jgi:hypothetical protein
VSGPADRVSGEPAVPGDVALMDAVPSSGGALVAWRTASDKTSPQTAILRLAAFEPSAGYGEHLILRAPDVVHSLDDVSLAVGFGHVGIVGTTWTTGTTGTVGSRCSFHPLTLDGASNGGTVIADSRACAGLTATASGFDLLVAERTGTRTAALLRTGLDPQGAPLAAPATLVTAGAGEALGSPKRATFDDSSFLLLVARDATRSVLRRFDRLGVPLGPESTLFESVDVVFSSIVPTRTGALAVFVTYSNGPVGIFSVPLDREGNALRAPEIVYSWGNTSSFAFSSDPNGGALLAWTQAPVATGAGVLSLDEQGYARPPALDLTGALVGASFAPAIRVIAIGTQGLAIVEASTPSTPHRVYAVPLSCAP